MVVAVKVVNLYIKSRNSRGENKAAASTQSPVETPKTLKEPGSSSRTEVAAPVLLAGISS